MEGYLSPESEARATGAPDKNVVMQSPWQCEVDMCRDEENLCVFERLIFEFCFVIQLNLVHPVSFSSRSLCTCLPG